MIFCPDKMRKKCKKGKRPSGVYDTLYSSPRVGSTCIMYVENNFMDFFTEAINEVQSRR